MMVDVLLATLRERGVTLVATGDRLRFRPAALVTAEERAALGHDRDAVLAHLRTEERQIVAEAVELFGARVVYRTPPGLRCGRCGGEEWRPRRGIPGEFICARCWSADGTTLRPFEELVPPEACPTCGGPAWRVCGTWRCTRCEQPAPATRDTEPPPREDEREAVRLLAAAAGFPRTPLAPAVAILPGAVAWQRFVVTARAAELAAARAVLEGLPSDEAGHG
jgi:hypothetical protein